MDHPDTSTDTQPGELLRFPTNDDPLLTLRVADGRLTADYDPDNLDPAAQHLVDELVRRWSKQLAEVQHITTECLNIALASAAAQQPPRRGEPVIAVRTAAQTVADVMWKP